MSGLGFDPKRFRRLMAAEELLKRMREIQRGEASPQEESVLPLPTEQKTESRSEPEKDTGPAGSGGPAGGRETARERA